MDAKERKKIQNRMAQRTYRIDTSSFFVEEHCQAKMSLAGRNQKERLRSLELAVGQRIPDIQQTLPLTPLNSQSDQIWPSLIEESCQSSLRLPGLETSEATQLGNFEEDKSSSRESEEGNVEPFESFMIDTHSSLKRTSLHRAIFSRRETVARLLLDQGADAGKHDSNGHTALHLAVQSGQENLVKVLLESKVNPNLRDGVGQTALFEAIRSDDDSMAKILLESSIDVNSRDNFGDVALHVAVEKGSELMIGILLSYGADIDA